MSLSKRRVYGACLVLAALVISVWALRPAEQRFVHASLDPYDEPVLSEYRRYRDALLQGDRASLGALMSARDDYLAYRVALTLAGANLGAAERLPYYRRALALRLDDPLDKVDKRAFLLEYAQTAQRAGAQAEALRIYTAALPETEAVAALYRLQSDPYKLSNTFLKAKLYEETLAALDGRTAPSLEAPAYRALRDYEAAQDAYERWLLEQPGNLDARFGEAWTSYYLGDYERAERLFAALPGASALRGRSLIAWQRGEVERAVALLEQTGDADYLWYATGYLESLDRYEAALPLYLRLAQGTSSYADDAAYRALTLAERLGDAASADEARGRLAANSFFALRAGESLNLEITESLERVTPRVVDLSNALARVGDEDAAVGELLFALRDSVGVAERVAIAEQLQLLGEFRQSARVGTSLLSSGVTDRRVWELAYPQAYAQAVGTEAVRNGLEPHLIWAIMRQESAFFPEALSRSNARGLMQVIPSTWNWLAELQNETPGEPFDVATNVRYGSFYLRWLLDYLEDDPELVIASYNRGQGYIKRLFEGAVVAGDKDELYREIDAFETREYLQRVAINYEIYKTLYPGVVAERP